MTVVNPEMLMLARESRALTQGQLANAAGITQGAVSKAENGLRALTEEHLIAVADALGYPASFFMQQDAVMGTERLHPSPEAIEVAGQGTSAHPGADERRAASSASPAPAS